MRHFIYMFSLLTVAACSNEDQMDSAPSRPTAFKDLLTEDEGANPANPFDANGRNYLTLLEGYEALLQKPVGAEAILFSLENIAANFGLPNAGYNPSVSQGILSVKNLAQTNIEACISGLTISSGAKLQLTSCLNQLQSLKQDNEEYDTVYTILKGFEGTILSSTLTGKDKEVLLTTLSITRYAIYNTSRKKRRDRDWELSVGNIMATAYGAAESQPNAVLNGTASGLLE